MVGIPSRNIGLVRDKYSHFPSIEDESQRAYDLYAHSLHHKPRHRVSPRQSFPFSLHRGRVSNGSSSIAQGLQSSITVVIILPAIEYAQKFRTFGYRRAPDLLTEFNIILLPDLKEDLKDILERSWMNVKQNGNLSC